MHSLSKATCICSFLFGSDSTMEQKLEELEQMKASATQRRAAVIAKATVPDRPPGVFVSGADKPREPAFPPVKASEPKAPVKRPVDDSVLSVKRPALVEKAKPSSAPVVSTSVSSEPACVPEQVNLDSGVPTVSPDANAKLESLVQQYGAAQIVKIVHFYEVLRDTMP